MRIASSPARCVCVSMAFAVLASLSLGAQAEPSGARGCAGTDYNAMILDIIKGLPSGGGYSRGGSFQLPTITAHNIGGGHWEMRVYDGFPSHCTSATYVVLARLIAVLQDKGRIALSGEQIEGLAAKNRMPDGTTLVDGQGAFQIFNANGAGTAALLKHTGTGMSFRDDKLAYARPGDFLKMFWNDMISCSDVFRDPILSSARIGRIRVVLNKTRANSASARVQCTLCQLNKLANDYRILRRLNPGHHDIWEVSDVRGSRCRRDHRHRGGFHGPFAIAERGRPVRTRGLSALPGAR